MATSNRIEGIGGGSRGGSRGSGGITGKGGVNVNPKYKEVGPSVKVKKPGSMTPPALPVKPPKPSEYKPTGPSVKVIKPGSMTPPKIK